MEARFLTIKEIKNMQGEKSRRNPVVLNWIGGIKLIVLNICIFNICVNMEIEI